MIKNFIANGASYTEHIDHPDGITKTWATYLAEEMAVERHVNLASSGVGNDYICHSTINYLEANDLVPKETLVVVMWPGPDRIDVPISQDWYTHLKPEIYSVCKSDGISHWAGSGGLGGSWQRTSMYKEIFGDLYKIVDPVDLCMQSLRHFILLESYLKQQEYKFIFISDLNRWDTTKKYNQLINFEFNIGYHCKEQPIFKNFDFSNWLFINDAKDSISEFASVDINKAQGFHPSDEMHRRFAREILLPAIRKFQ